MTAEQERATIVAWLRSHDGQDERAIASGQCTRFSTAAGELRDQAFHYCEAADAIEAGDHLPKGQDHD